MQLYTPGSVYVNLDMHVSDELTFVSYRSTMYINMKRLKTLAGVPPGTHTSACVNERVGRPLQVVFHPLKIAFSLHY